MRPYIAALILGCAMKGPAAVPTPEDACKNTTTVYVDSVFFEHERRDFWAAANAWTKATERRECFVEGDMATASIHVYRAADRGVLWEKLQWADWASTAGLWWTDTRSIWIVTEHYSDVEITTIAAHELGHALGLPHSKAPKWVSVLSPMIDDDFPMIPGSDIPVYDVLAYCKINGC